MNPIIEQTKCRQCKKVIFDTEYKSDRKLLNYVTLGDSIESIRKENARDHAHYTKLFDVYKKQNYDKIVILNDKILVNCPNCGPMDYIREVKE